MKVSFEIARSLAKGRTGASIKSRTVQPYHASALRAAGEHNRKMRETMGRTYDAAVTTNLNTDFGISITSANAEIFTSIMGARSRARRLERDNPYVYGILNSYRDNVGGHEPFRLQMKVGKFDAKGKFHEETDTCRLIETAWKKYCRPENFTVCQTMSFAETSWQAISAVVRDGGILARHHRFFPNNPFGYAIEPIETDCLDHFYMRAKQPGVNEIRFSIELNNYKAPVAYHILTRHPGDVFANSNDAKYRERVPASDIVALWDIRTRAGQLVGMPRFASIIQRLHRIDQFDIAHVTAAIWASCKPFFMTQDMPTAEEYVPDAIRNALNTVDGWGAAAGDKFSSSEPATGEVLPYGMKPVLIDPNFPIESAPDFKKDNLRGVAAGSSVPYHIIGNDLEGVNFSSGRLGLQQYQATCKSLQNHIIANYCHPVFNNWIAESIANGALDLPMSRIEEFRDAACFLGVRWPYVNPLQDAQADILRLEAGLTSPTEIISNSDRGGDAEKVASEIAADREAYTSHSLDFWTEDVSDPTIKKGAPNQPQPKSGDAETPAAGKKARLINYDRLEKTLRILHETDPEFAETNQYPDFLAHRRARNGELTAD